MSRHKGCKAALLSTVRISIPKFVVPRGILGVALKVGVFVEATLAAVMSEPVALSGAYGFAIEIDEVVSGDIALTVGAGSGKEAPDVSLALLGPLKACLVAS